MTRMMRSADQPVLSLREAMDRLFEQSFTPFTRAMAGEMGGHSVPANLWEDADGYHLYLLAPGADAESVEITAINGTLTIAGQMKAPAPQDAKQIWQEWGPTQFRRQFQLPAGFDADRCQATYRDGILTVSVPKPEQTKPKAIKVQVQG